MGSEPPFRYVTAALQVNYRLPTPLGPPLELRACIDEIKGRKTVVSVQLFADEKMTANGEVIAVQMPDNMLSEAPIDGI